MYLRRYRGDRESLVVVEMTINEAQGWGTNGPKGFCVTVVKSEIFQEFIQIFSLIA